MVDMKRWRGRWLLAALLALAPLWIVGMFNRGYWTPDEPREADIAWRMSIQVDHTLPQLADTLFLEKPPLSYWLSAAAMHTVGVSAASARLPNLLYAIIVTVAIGLLARSMVSATAASIAAIVAGSAFTAYQVAIWLTPDASLVAGCALALLGLYRGYVAARGGNKLLWYTVMHLGAMIGFMAKSAPGWIAPGLALLVLIVWERRWRELICWELWAGLLLQIVGIGAWVAAVLAEPDGLSALKVLFWNNLAGRFTDLHASGALDYASAHQNWPGKYLVELPYHLFPWTFLVIAALYRAWTAVRIVGTAGTPWRFAIAASLPFLILLSLATTARGIYAAPSLLGFAILVGLWADELTQPAKANNRAVHATRYAVGALAIIMLACVCLIAVTELHTAQLPGLIIAAVGMIIIVSLAISLSIAAHRQQRIHWSLGWCYVVFVTSMGVGGTALLPIVDQWQDLRPIAQAVNRDTVGHELGLIQPDETTIAMLDYQLRTPFSIIEITDQDAVQAVKRWLDADPKRRRVLIKLPGSGPGELSALLNNKRDKLRSDSLLSRLEQANVAHLVTLYQRPEGRRYALIGANTN